MLLNSAQIYHCVLCMREQMFSPLISRKFSGGPIILWWGIVSLLPRSSTSSIALSSSQSPYQQSLATILRSQPSGVVTSCDHNYRTMKHADCTIQLYLIYIIFTLGYASEYLHKYVPIRISSRSLFHSENSTQDTGLSPHVRSAPRT